MNNNFDSRLDAELALNGWYLNGVTPLSEYTTMDRLAKTSHAPASYVYFIQCGNFIKIGCSANPEERVNQLRRGGKALRPSVWEGNPFLIGYVPGTKKDERGLHTDFKNLHDRGEWFRAAPELTERALEAQRTQVRLEVSANESHRIAQYRSAGLEAPAVDLEKITEERLAELAINNVTAVAV